MTKIKELEFNRIEEWIPPHGMECIVLTANGSVLNAFRNEQWKGGFVNTTIMGVGGMAVPDVVGWIPKPRLREPSSKIKTVETPLPEATIPEVSATETPIPDLNLNPEAVYDLKVGQKFLLSDQVLIFTEAGSSLSEYHPDKLFVLTTVRSNVDLYNQLVRDGLSPEYSAYIQHFRGPSDRYEDVKFTVCACHTRKGIYDLIVNKAYTIS